MPRGWSPSPGGGERRRRAAPDGLSRDQHVPKAVAYDPANAELWIASEDGSVKVHARTASGTATPLRSWNAAANFGVPAAIVVDGANDEVILLGTLPQATPAIGGLTVPFNFLPSLRGLTAYRG